MSITKTFYFTCITGMLLSASCLQQHQQQQVSDDSLKEHLVNVNKIMVEDESKKIDEFISRHQWKMTVSGTGLRYQVYEEGKGRHPSGKKQVSISYSVYLLDGTLCYAADEKKPLDFILGQGEQTHGLEEGVLLMKEGGKARLVVPAHLGFGRLGDDHKIPGNSPLYYDVKLLHVNDLK
ncbi:MAG: FKBP-type peptidyl-prolyl cis-trans isomerase [Bacteroidetes bacterium]|nr:FKBP-type peptidyl-prolyl cis-trans isomerase [Bacteroidota bacterium]